MSSPDELTTQRFYLRKLEGAEILLAEEINFFRRELHKWAPVTTNPPPEIQVSLSTRKPRPTKQQKLMSTLGISNPEEIPAQYKSKNHNFKPRKSEDGGKGPHALQPAPEPSHTPPGSPQGIRRGFGEPEYFNPLPTAGFNNSPTFASSAPLTFGGSSSIQPIDPGLFEGGQGPASPIQDIFKSSGSGQEMFGEMMEAGGGQAEEALAVTESNGYDD
jgi:histone demethylase JARID1